MKKTGILFIAIGIIMASCAQKQEPSSSQDNPFFAEYQTPYQVPPFDQIQTSDYMPAFEKGMKEHKEEIEAIVSNTEQPTFENTVEAMVRSGKLLDRISYVFYGLNSANTSDELQEVAKEVSPRLSEHRDEIALNTELFERIRLVYENRDQVDLNQEESYLLEKIYKNFVRNGANLSDADKEKLKQINQELSSLTLEFEQNELKETNDFQLVIEDEKNLAGLPASVVQTAAETAERKGLEGKWVFTTHKPSMLPFLRYAENRDLREKLYKAYLNRGNNNNAYDNKEILSNIVDLRVKKANLLGYDTYADYQLETRMAGEPQNVMDLLNKLWDAALPVAKEERKQMQQIIDEEGKDFELKSWDWWYYAEKLRKRKYDLDDSELRPYFKLDYVRQGAFDVATQLYGITFEEVKDIPKPHPDARAWEVKEADGSHLGLLYMDFHPRASKNGGAWCGSYRRHYKSPQGREVHPIKTIVCNFTTPTENKPALLSMDEVETLFHEFGHALDGLFAENTYPRTFVARDFVELPSQIMEHWASHPKVMKEYARHYDTGETIPDQLIRKIEKSSYFNQGFDNVEYLAASMLDMAYHNLSESQDLDVMEFEKKYLDEIGLIPEIEPRYHSTYFSHITGGYAAGYYSYIWSAVLDNDAFEAFEENGIYDPQTAEAFRTLLAKNGIKDPMELYVNFRGRKPREDALLRNRGLN
ncbi:MAG: M3 family metallopeptidase [Bacteroidales bacterium]|nr:M3 family metallopeptidase [Bacteroidales bacterium]